MHRDEGKTNRSTCMVQLFSRSQTVIAISNRTYYYFKSKKRYSATGRFILSTTKTKHCMSFADTLSPLSEIPPRFMVNTDTKRSFRKGPIPRGSLEKKLYWCNWFRRKKNKLNFQYKKAEL